MKKEHLAIIRRFCPQAPPLGTKVGIYLGTAKTDGRDHNCTVRGLQDKPKPAIVKGYRLEFAESAGAWPRGERTVNVLVTVHLKRSWPLIKGRLVTAHITCLDCVPTEPIDF